MLNIFYEQLEFKAISRYFEETLLFGLNNATLTKI
jgi:hypothetical protein